MFSKLDGVIDDGKLASQHLQRDRLVSMSFHLLNNLTQRPSENCDWQCLILSLFLCACICIWFHFNIDSNDPWHNSGESLFPTFQLLVLRVYFNFILHFSSWYYSMCHHQESNGNAIFSTCFQHLKCCPILCRKFRRMFGISVFHYSRKFYWYMEIHTHFIYTNYTQKCLFCPSVYL